MLKDIIFYILWTLSVIGAFSLNEREDGLEFQKVLENYDKSIHPRGLQGAPVVVLVDAVIDIEKIDDSAMKWSIRLTLALHWSDPRLKFKMLKNNTSFTIPESLFHKLWMPTLFFADNRNARYRLPYNEADSLQLRASQNGEMILTAKILLNMGCSMEFWNFPFDTQICSMKISHNHNPNDTIISWINSDPVRVLKNLHLTNFAFIQLSTNFCKINSENPSSEETSCLLVEAEFERQISFYQSTVYIPSVFAILMTWLSLFLDPLESGTARVIILGTSIVSGSFIGHLCKVPALYPTALGRWTTVCDTFLLMAVLEFVAVNRLAMRQRQRSVKTVKSGIDISGGEDNKENARWHLARDRKWHFTIDVLFLINYFLAFLVFNLRYYFTFVRRPDLDD